MARQHRYQFRNLALFLALLSVGFATSSCTSVKYLLQAGKGQLRLLNRARPLPDVIQDERTPPRIKFLLSQVEGIKLYGEKHGLKPTRNYTEYVKLEESAAVWVVTASDPLQFKPKVWSFPIAGSFNYIGWFKHEDAVDFGESIKKEESLDVDVRGASAYSTLGWFRDAILSTMIPQGDSALGTLANTIIHESVHASIYVNGQSYFNESIASFVADKLTPIYLKEFHGKEDTKTKAYLENEIKGDQNVKRLHEAYQVLDELYKSKRTNDEKLSEKARILTKLKEDLQFKREINNATLVNFRTYGVGMKEFDMAFKKCGEDWSRFWKLMHSFKSESFGKEHTEEIGKPIEMAAKAGC